MAKLIYMAIASLDGYIEDEHGTFGWAAPDDEVHAFFNDRTRPIGMYLYGRRMYETMQVWETDPSLASESPIMGDFAQLWQTADKVVYSTTLDSVVTANTRIERTFDADAVRQLLASAERDITIGGATLAQHAFAAGLVNECHLYLVPVSVGGGKPCLPQGVQVQLALLNAHQFTNGTMYLHYQVNS